MLFNSLILLVFAAVFFALWPLFRGRNNLRWAFIVVASFIFYGWWDWRFLFLLIGSGIIDYFAALGMAKYSSRKLYFLLLSILGNIGSLVVFKYSAFFAENFDLLIALTGSSFRLRSHIPHFMMALPVGISFYTFQSMSYTIDVYRGKLAPTRNPLHMFAFLALFPQLLAGPIARATQLLPQLEKKPHATGEQIWDGLKLIVHGFFKKMVIADNLARSVNLAFGDVAGSPHSAIFWWIIMMMFGFQIYCDFSGYSDIARGLAKWMGYELSLNFDHPFTSTSLREFWRRWHISLVRWFNDYIFIPLGGSRAGEWKYYRNIWIVMLILGLWHGASMTFIFWGVANALLFSIERLTGWPDRLKAYRGGKHIALILTFGQWLMACVFFQANSFQSAIHVIAYMFNFKDWTLPINIEPMFFLLIGVVRELTLYAGWDKKWDALMPNRPYLDPIILSVMIAAIIFLRGPGSAFIYFQF